MSIRTLIEVNHDYIGRWTEADLHILVRVLSSGSTVKEPIQGVRVIGQRHHSDPEFVLAKRGQS